MTANGATEPNSKGRLTLDIEQGCLALQAKNVSGERVPFMLWVFAKRKPELESKLIVLAPGYDPQGDPDFVMPIMTAGPIEPGETFQIKSSPISVDLSKFFFYTPPDARGRFFLEIMQQGKTNLLPEPGLV